LLQLQARQIASMIVSGIQPIQNLSVLKKHGMEHKNEWAQWAITKGFAGAYIS
jgi:maleylacetoacetate isomerase